MSDSTQEPQRQRRLDDSGQSLIETALLLPLLLTLVFNAVNFGYFFYVMLTLDAAPRQGVEYSIQGEETYGNGVPDATQITNLVKGAGVTPATNLGTLHNGSGATVEVCSSSVGTVVNANHTVTTSCNDGSTAGPDPEGTHFVMHRVKVSYKVTPLIPGSAFTVALPSAPSQQVSMRGLF